MTDLMADGLPAEPRQAHEERTGDDMQDDIAATNGSASAAPDPSPVLEPATVRWQRSYDRASVERFAAEVEAHRARLKAEIDAARAAADLAEVQAGRGAGTSPADLGELVVAAQRELEQLEREHNATVDAIRTAAEAEVERVLTAARAEVEAVSSSAAAISALVDRGVQSEGAGNALGGEPVAGEPADAPVSHVDAG